MLARLTIIPQIVQNALGLSLVSFAGTDRRVREDAGIKSRSASEEILVLVEPRWAVHSGPCIGEAQSQVVMLHDAFLLLSQLILSLFIYV
jgi:hypothetical protein